jgi:DHA1 family inner membrane transport protein
MTQPSPVPTAPMTPRSRWLAVIALAIGAFGIGSTEFMPAGLLTNMAGSLHVSIPAAGMIVSAYALGVVIGAPTLTALSARFRRRDVLVGLAAMFVVGNLLTAIAPTYWTVLIARVLTALSHGAFFGVGAVVARRVAPPGKEAQAISYMFTGLTIANVAGVPAGTWLGNATSWRVSFAVVAAIGLVTMTAVLRWVPVESDRPAPLRSELGAFRKPQVWLTLGITAIGFGGLFAMYSYISPILTHEAGLGSSAITVALVLYGIGTTVGTLAGGWLTDRAPTGTIYGGLAAQAVVLLLFMFTSRNGISAIATLFVFGAVSFVATTPVQHRVVVAAGGDGSLVSATNQAAFNFANALGAWLGGLVIGAGLGLRAPMWVGAALACAGIAITFVASRMDKAQKRREAPGIDADQLALAV